MTHPRSHRGAAGAGQTDAAVEALLAGLDHPLLADLRDTRALVLGASPRITECVKWKAPTFRTSDDFATLHLRSLKEVQLIFHTGAKVKSSAKDGVPVADPDGLLKWLAKDRALATLGSGEELRAKGPALQALVRAWVELLDSFT